MPRILSLILCCLAAAALMAGCSSDEPTAPAAGGEPIKSVISGDIDPGATAFEYAAGTFKVRGSNLRYEADPGALLADIVLVNDSATEFPGPARLLFMQLLPAGVTILNPDNPDGPLGGGALFTFAFADTDTLWRAGAATEPRTVEFGVAPGTSVGFVSRILVGDEPTDGGAIGGLVWHDLNENGMLDQGEAGARDIELILHDGTEAAPQKAMMSTTTDPSGHYRFEALAAGHYTVALAADERIMPTTSPVIEVLLVAFEGQVADFLDAHFGVKRTAAPPDTMPCPEVGDCINAKGAYLSEPDRLAARILDVCDRRDECEGEDDDDGDCVDCEDDKTGDGMCWGRLSGPITDIDVEGRAIAVMGTWVHLPEADWGKHDRDGDIAVGRRVRVNAEVVAGEDGDRVVACRIHKWDGHGDRVRGYVQEVVRDENGIMGLRVLNTLVTVPEGFTCDDGGGIEER